MEFTTDLFAFQGVITSADNIHTFSRLTDKGGNNEKIKDVVKILLKFLKEKNYVNKKGVNPDEIKSMRKFALYIVLNTDLPVLNEMIELEGIESVRWTIPTVTKYLMCEMLWNFHMEIFLYEIISFTYPQLALDVAESFIDSIKYLTPAECLHKVKLLSSGCYRLLCRLNFFNTDIQSNCVHLASNCFKKSINFFTNPPNFDKLTMISKDEQYKYIGNSFHMLVILILECLENFTSKQEFEPSDFDEIYLLTYKEGSIAKKSLDSKACDSPNIPIVECLDKCNMALLDTCKELVMSISVDIYCAWSEFEEKGKSMQKTIGEVCYKLRRKLQTIGSVSEHPVVNMLEQISCKPIDLTDVINCADRDTFIKNIENNNDEKIFWIRALIEKEELRHDLTLIKILSNNIYVLNEDDCYRLYQKLNNPLNNNPGATENETIDILAVKVFQKCSNRNKLDILENCFKNKCFFDMAENKEFNGMLTEIFNKLIATLDADLSDVWGVFIQSPQKVYNKIYGLATENAQQVNIMLKVMVLLKEYSDHYYSFDTQPCIIRITQEFFENDLVTESKKVNFVTFIKGLKNNGIISGSKLLLLISMPNLHKALLSKDVGSINTQVMLLDMAFNIDELLEYRAPMLAMLAQVLDVVRWKFDTFVVLAPATLQLTLQLQQSLFNTFRSEIPDNESKWLKNRLKNMQPLNMYYYRILWNPPGKSFVEIVSGTEIHVGINMEQLTIWLSQVICSSIQEEWCEIWDSVCPVFGDIKTLDLFHSAVQLMAVMESSNRTEATWPCLLNCYRNFIYIIRYKFFTDPLTADQVIHVVSKIKEISNLSNAACIEDVGTALLPLLGYIVERKTDHSVDVADSLKNELTDKRLLDMINHVFSNGVQ